jgi:acyl-CoA synthetase (AMP-forming)/AMP-acid ligase II
MPPSLPALLDHRRLLGLHPAFIEGASGRMRTWADLGRATDAWRHFQDQLGPAGKDIRVGLLVADPLEMVSCYLAGLAAGVTVAPLNPEAPPAELTPQIARLGLDALVVDRAAPSSVDAITGPGVDLWRSHDGRLDLLARRRSGPIRAQDSRPALLLASSGTTGTPKVVPLDPQQLLATAGGVVSSHQLTADDRGYCPLPLFHINALVVGVLSTVVAGSSCVIDRRFSVRSFWDTVERHDVTWINLVPPIIAILADQPAPPKAVRRRVAFARSASAPLPITTLARFEERCRIPVLETYGMTEAASQITANPRALEQRRVGSVGRPVGVELRIADDEGGLVAPGVIGRVQIRGARVSSSYWQPAGMEPPTSPALGPDGWLDTGDLGRLDDDGFLFLVGRDDDVINRGGEKVHPREVEEILLRDPEVAFAAVVGRPHPTSGEEPVAYVLAGPTCGDEAALAGRLALLCDQELSRFKRPADITIAKRLPTGPTGKVRRAELRRVAASGVE